MTTALEVITEDVWSAQGDFARVCVDKSIRFEAEAGFAIQTLQSNEYALSIAMKNRQSVINAVTNIAGMAVHVKYPGAQPELAYVRMVLSELPVGIRAFFVIGLFGAISPRSTATTSSAERRSQMISTRVYL